MYHVLDKLTDSLEELSLGEYCALDVSRTVNTAMTVLDKFYLATMSEEEAAVAIELIPKRPLFLPKLTTLYLDLNWKLSGLKPIYDLVRAFLALRTLIIRPNSILDFKRMQLILREFCPKLGIYPIYSPPVALKGCASGQ